MAKFHLILTRTKILRCVNKRHLPTVISQLPKLPSWESPSSTRLNSQQRTVLLKLPKSRSIQITNKCPPKAQTRLLDNLIALCQQSPSKSVDSLLTFCLLKWTSASSTTLVKSTESTTRKLDLSTSTGFKISRTNILTQNKRSCSPTFLPFTMMMRMKTKFSNKTKTNGKPLPTEKIISFRMEITSIQETTSSLICGAPSTLTTLK